MTEPRTTLPGHPTTTLRWKVRPNPTADRPVLQQLWKLTATADRPSMFEWRDVPTEVEETDDELEPVEWEDANGSK